MRTQPARRLVVPGRVWPDPSKKGQRACVGRGLRHGRTERCLCSLCPPSILTAAAGSISGGRGEAQLPQRSYCSLCPPGYSAGEGRETGRLVTAVGPCCTVRPALSDAFPVPTPGTRWPLYHGSGSLSRLQAWLCPPDRGQGMPRSPLPGSRALCQPRCWQGAAAGGLGLPGTALRAAARGWQGSAHPTWAPKGPLPWQRQRGRQRQGREAALLPIASGGGPRRQEGRRAAVQSPELSRGPLLPCPGTAQRRRAREHGGGAGVGDIRVLQKKQTLPGAVQTERELSSQHSPASAPAPVPESTGRIRQAPGRVSRGRREQQQDGVPGLPLPGNLICSQSRSEGLVVRKPPRIAGSANRPSIC